MAPNVPILDSRFWILDCGLKQHDSHCGKRLRGERGSSSIAFMRGSGRGHPLSGERTGPPTLWYLGYVDGPQCATCIALGLGVHS